MHVHVRYFAGAAAAAGTAEETLDLTPDAAPPALPDLLARLSQQHGEGLARVLAASSFLVDGVAAGPGSTLADGCTLDVLPPFAGG